MNDESNKPNPLLASHVSPLERVTATLADLSGGWAKLGSSPYPAPLQEKPSDKRGKDWFPEPEWMSGWDIFELLRLQTEPYEWAPPLARICLIISDQVDREEAGLNYVLGGLPPTHALLADFELGSHRWFRALYSLLKLDGAEKIDGWESLVSELYDWVAGYDQLRIRTRDALNHVLRLDWAWYEYSLPEAKQEPIWSFPKAMAWIATRDYLALARVGYFRRPSDDDEAVATQGVCKHNTAALGWLHSLISYTHCNCGAFSEFRLEAYKHCTCISIAWEELVRFNGGLSAVTPELVFNLQEGWLSMTWPEGVDGIRFLRRDILDRWPARTLERPEVAAVEQSTAAGEKDCCIWLVKQFCADPDKRRSKKDFRGAALAEFQGRLSERGFNLRVWPDLARKHGRDGAGAKRKS